MPDGPAQSKRYRLWPINGRILVGISLTGVFIAGIVACFAYAGGALSPDRLTQDRMINAFQQVNGIHPGFRRNHAKGMCIAGHFDSNGNGARLSKAAVFSTGRIPVIGVVRRAPRSPPWRL
jgi:catalase